MTSLHDHKDPYGHLPAHSRERVRRGVATQYLVGSRLMGDGVSDVENLKRAGYRSENEYWAAAVAGPMDVPFFAHFLAGFHLNPAMKDHQVLELSIQAVLRRARRTNQTFFIIDPQNPERGPDDFERLSLDPRAALEWLLSMPADRGLVPEGLCAFLEQNGGALAETEEYIKTGAPGRPTSMHLVKEEADRRRTNGEADKFVKSEAKKLKTWFDQQYAGMPSPTAKTIENRIREEHRAWREKPRN